MNKSPNQIVYEKAYQWSDTTLEKIKVKPLKYSGSQKCHQVAFNRAYLHNEPIVIALMFIPKSGARIHFVNKHGNTYRDNTLGYLSKYNTFFKITELKWDELKDYDHPLGAEYLLVETKLNILNILFSVNEQEELGLSLNNI